ncbi:hypothetical protein GCM10023238_09380 [Streptomyces heliomycini]
MVVASTKSGSELFSTFTFWPGTGLADNLSDLSAYRDGVYWRWMGNSALYAGWARCCRRACRRSAATRWRSTASGAARRCSTCCSPVC